MFDAIAHSILQAMATLHQGTIATFDFESRQILGAVEVGSLAIGDVGEVGIFRGKRIMGTVLSLRVWRRNLMITVA